MASAEVPVCQATGPILVTGVAGFIGCFTAVQLLERGEVVIGIDEVNDYYDTTQKRANLSRLVELGGDRYKLYEGDICDETLLNRIYDDASGSISRIVHLAARAGVRPSIEDPFVYIHPNIEGTTRLMEVARRRGNASFVMASSSSVYGDSVNDAFTEEDSVDNPVSPYAASKKACELLAYTYHHLYKMNIACLRFFTVYGPSGRPDMAPFKFVDWIYRGKEIQQFGDGSSERDYTYIEDIVDGVIRSMDRPAGYQVYNLGNGSPISLVKFIDLAQQAVGIPAKIKILPMQPGDVQRTCADISKARTMLGYNPKTPFETGLQATAKWYCEEYAPSRGIERALEESMQ